MGTASGAEAVDAYIAALPGESAALVREVRELVTSEVPGGTECISYGIPTVDLDGRHLVHYAGYARHVAVYPVNDLPDDLRRRLEPHLSGRATARFASDQPLPRDLVTAIVQHQLRRHQAHQSQQ